MEQYENDIHFLFSIVGLFLLLFIGLLIHIYINPHAAVYFMSISCLIAIWLLFGKDFFVQLRHEIKWKIKGEF